ncbi:MAG: riboflavin synthase subunit alpha [Porticoccaceae bacterium]|nr:MAG: riboflavin synthase subunit alpha [Porticoccaceae bacterium]
MFTGIVEAVGEVVAVERRGAALALAVDARDLDLSGARVGESIAVDGVCLTATAFDGRLFWADLSPETLALTTLGAVEVGRRVNLERAMPAQGRFGGHLVTGHVDGVGEVVARALEGDGVRLRIRAPQALAPYLARKGSVAVDGVSLTVNEVAGAEFALALIPHTLAHTTLDQCDVGRRVNLEVDIIARYLERLLAAGGGPGS